MTNQTPSKCCNSRIREATELEKMLGVPNFFCSKCGKPTTPLSEPKQGSGKICSVCKGEITDKNWTSHAVLCRHSKSKINCPECQFEEGEHSQACSRYEEELGEKTLKVEEYLNGASLPQSPKESDNKESKL